MKKKRTKPYKVGAIWWVGWVATIPLRLLLMFFLGIMFSVYPSAFFKLFNSTSPMEEKDQSKWKF